jgi:Fe-S-cluster formation regulator IscX/YfhJ
MQTVTTRLEMKDFWLYYKIGGRSIRYKTEDIVYAMESRQIRFDEVKQWIMIELKTSGDTARRQGEKRNF